jgi:hypothetical protein
VVKGSDFSVIHVRFSANVMTPPCTCSFSLAFWLAYKFTGKERDTETGLDYFGARYYSQNIGRFASVDPIALNVLRQVAHPFAVECSASQIADELNCCALPFSRSERWGGSS